MNGNGIGIVSPFVAPVGQICAARDIDEVRELTKGWQDSRDLTPVFKLVAEARVYGFKLVKADA